MGERGQKNFAKNGKRKRNPCKIVCKEVSLLYHVENYYLGLKYDKSVSSAKGKTCKGGMDGIQ